MTPAITDRLREEAGPPPGPSVLLAHIPSLSGEGAIDLSRLQPAVRDAIRAARKPLPWLTALMELWEPLYDAGRFPADEMIREFLAGTDMEERDRERFRERLEAALRRGPAILPHVLDLLARVRARVEDPHERRLAEVLGNAAQDLKRLYKAGRSKGAPWAGAVVVHPDTRPRAEWTLNNLRLLLAAYWALQKAHEDRLRRLASRFRRFNRLAGSFEGPEDLAEDHSLRWNDED